MMHGRACSVRTVGLITRGWGTPICIVPRLLYDVCSCVPNPIVTGCNL